MHDVVVVGLPLLAILEGTLFNNRDIARLERRLDRIEDEIGGMRNELTGLRSEMHREFEQFYRTLGQHDAKIEILEKHRQKCSESPPFSSRNTPLPSVPSQSRIN